MSALVRTAEWVRALTTTVPGESGFKMLEKSVILLKLSLLCLYQRAADAKFLSPVFIISLRISLHIKTRFSLRY